MKDKIELEKAGDIILEEFMKPNNLTFGKLAKEIGIEIDYLKQVINSNHMTLLIDLCLTKYFCLSEGYFLRLQEDYKQRKEK